MGRSDKEKSTISRLAFLKYIAAVAAGCVNGLFGGGGGMLIVPLLSSFRLSAKKAHATAVAVVLPLCLISAVIYSALLLKKADNFWLSIFFYAVMIGAGVKMTVGR